MEFQEEIGMLRPDRRQAVHLGQADTCRNCDCLLMQTTGDRRQGYCFDCYDPFEAEWT